MSKTVKLSICWIIISILGIGCGVYFKNTDVKIYGLFLLILCYSSFQIPKRDTQRKIEEASRNPNIKTTVTLNKDPLDY